MEELKAQGLTKSIGVSNYLPEHLDWIFETCKVPPAVNQIEFHPYLQHEPLIEYHKKKASLNSMFNVFLVLTHSIRASPLAPTVRLLP
jgi:diketogulonate reductase-like aldo/keto reductase